MNNLALYIAINEIDESLIAEADKHSSTEKSVLPYKRIFSSAAKIAAVITAVLCAIIYSHSKVSVLPTRTPTTVTQENLIYSTTHSMKSDKTTPPQNEEATFTEESSTDYFSGEFTSNIDMVGIDSYTHISSAEITETQKNQELAPDYSLYTLSMWLNEPNVIWSNENIKGESVIAEKTPFGTVKITDSLKELFKQNSEETVYAVLVDFSSSIDEEEAESWKYNGVSLSELQDGFKMGNYEKKEDIVEYKNKIREIKSAYYKMQVNSFNETFNGAGLKIYTDNKEMSSGSYYFYTFATELQLKKLTCKSDEAFVLAPAVKFKQN